MGGGDLWLLYNTAIFTSMGVGFVASVKYCHLYIHGVGGICSFCTILPSLSVNLICSILLKLTLYKELHKLCRITVRLN